MTCLALRSDITRIKNISNQCFGNNYLNISTINSAIESNSLLVIKENGEVIGFCLFSISNRDKADSYQSQIETLAVSKNYQNKGYGSILLNNTIKIIRSQSIKNIFYKGWLEGPNHFFIDKIKSLGFQKIKTIRNYWKKQSIEEGFICDLCGAPPCKCTLNLYQLTLRS